MDRPGSNRLTRLLATLDRMLRIFSLPQFRVNFTEARNNLHSYLIPSLVAACLKTEVVVAYDLRASSDGEWTVLLPRCCSLRGGRCTAVSTCARNSHRVCF